jgi:hypothetical protein
MLSRELKTTVPEIWRWSDLGIRFGNMLSLAGVCEAGSSSEENPQESEIRMIQDFSFEASRIAMIDRLTICGRLGHAETILCGSASW